MHHLTVLGRTTFNRTHQPAIWQKLQLAQASHLIVAHPVKKLMTEGPRVLDFGCNNRPTVGAVRTSAKKPKLTKKYRLLPRRSERRVVFHCPMKRIRIS